MRGVKWDGGKLLQIRVARRQTGDAFAALLGMSAGHLSRLERNVSVPSLAMIERIEQALQLRPAEFGADIDTDHAPEQAPTQRGN